MEIKDSEQALKERGKDEGLVKIYSQLENCNRYKPWTDKTTGKTYFKCNVVNFRKNLQKT